MATVSKHTMEFRSGAPCACGFCREADPIGISRRGMLAGATMLATGMSLAAGRARAQTKLSPDAALAQLMEGNARFVADKLTSIDTDLTILKEKTVEKQEPFAALLSCADSRVPVELIFDQSIGHLFVTRVAGNICSPEVIASLEYGAAVLGTVVIVVLGHSNCGAMEAAIAGKAVPGQISALYAPIRPAIDRAGTDLAAATKTNAQLQAGLLRTASPVLVDLASAGKLKVVAGYYDLGSGRVSLLG